MFLPSGVLKQGLKTGDDNTKPVIKLPEMVNTYKKVRGNFANIVKIVH